MEEGTLKPTSSGPARRIGKAVQIVVALVGHSAYLGIVLVELLFLSCVNEAWYISFGVPRRDLFRLTS